MHYERNVVGDSASIVHSDSCDHIPIITIMIYNERMLGMTLRESEHTNKVYNLNLFYPCYKYVYLLLI